MRILQVHNKYRPAWGGEDTVADLEADLLRRNGHVVERVSAWTGQLNGASALQLIRSGFGAVWSFSAFEKMKNAITSFSPDVVHVHNDFPLFSPSIFWASEKAGVPIVQTMHNYRLACANAVLLRDGKPCEACVGQFPWPALRHRCYGRSVSRTLAVVSRNVLHRWAGTYRTKIQAYLALTKFSKDILVRAGLPAEKVFVKPNFTGDPGLPVQLRQPRVVFAGWMTHLKGLHLLLEAWAGLAPNTHQLVLVGDGPERSELERRFGVIRSIKWCGSRSRDDVISLVAGSRWLVQPSLAYENCPMSVLEAFSVGTPVIVPNHGAFSEMVSGRQEGLLFSADDAASLALALQDAVNFQESSWMQWSLNARAKFLREYSDAASYEQLIRVYRYAIEHVRASQSPISPYAATESGSSN